MVSVPIADIVSVMSYRDPLEAARARIAALETEVAELRDTSQVSRLQAEAEQWRKEAEGARALAALTSAARGAEHDHQAELESASREATDQMLASQAGDIERLRREVDGLRSRLAEATAAGAEPPTSVLDEEVSVLRSLDPLRCWAWYASKVVTIDGELEELRTQSASKETELASIPADLRSQITRAASREESDHIADLCARRDVLAVELEDLRRRRQLQEARRQELVGLIERAARDAAQPSRSPGSRELLLAAVIGCSTCERFVTGLQERELEGMKVIEAREVRLHLAVENLLYHTFGPPVGLRTTCPECGVTTAYHPRTFRNVAEFEHVDLVLPRPLPSALLD